MLRKTMLDECKGEKFEELLATFSIIVLKKRLASTDPHIDTMSTTTANILPLVLAHRKGIQRDLEKRKELDLQAKQQERNIRADIEVLAAEAASLKRRKAPGIPEHADALARIVRENWIGDHAWVETILHGIQPSRDANSESLYDDLNADGPSRLLADLHARVEAQSARLVRWQSYLTTLQERRQKHPSQVPTSQESQPKPSRFRRHQSLVTRGYSLHSSTKQSSKELRARTAEDTLHHELRPQHATLLQSLDRELTLQRPNISTHSLARSTATMEVRQTPVVDIENVRPLPARTSSGRSSDISSQRTVIEGRRTSMDSSGWSSSPPDLNRTPIRSLSANHVFRNMPMAVPVSPSLGPATRQQLLLERTRASLAQFEPLSGRPQTTLDVPEEATDEFRPLPNVHPPRQQLERASLLERTRQSMSLLTGALDDNFQPRSNSWPKKPTHARSKTAINIPQRPRLERAWSEDSLASTATKEDNVSVEADYEDVFKSRPRLATSPNLSPQLTGNDLWLESQLEEGMNKLNIDSDTDS